jgi:hypothetical protein
MASRLYEPVSALGKGVVHMYGTITTGTGGTVTASTVHGAAFTASESASGTYTVVCRRSTSYPTDVYYGCLHVGLTLLDPTAPLGTLFTHFVVTSKDGTGCVFQCRDNGGVITNLASAKVMIELVMNTSSVTES